MATSKKVKARKAAAVRVKQATRAEERMAAAKAAIENADTQRLSAETSVRKSQVALAAFTAATESFQAKAGALKESVGKLRAEVAGKLDDLDAMVKAVGAIAVPVVFDDLDEIVTIRNAALAERDAAVAERDAAVAERDAAMAGLSEIQGMLTRLERNPPVPAWLLRTFAKDVLTEEEIRVALNRTVVWARDAAARMKLFGDIRLVEDDEISVDPVVLDEPQVEAVSVEEPVVEDVQLDATAKTLGEAMAEAAG